MFVTSKKTRVTSFVIFALFTLVAIPALAATTPMPRTITGTQSSQADCLDPLTDADTHLEHGTTTGWPQFKIDAAQAAAAAGDLELIITDYNQVTLVSGGCHTTCAAASIEAWDTNGTVVLLDTSGNPLSSPFDILNTCYSTGQNVQTQRTFLLPTSVDVETLEVAVSSATAVACDYNTVPYTESIVRYKLSGVFPMALRY